MAKIENIYKFLKKKKILITGHSGFKGSWLSLWLIKIGCNVIGISKSTKNKRSNFHNFKFKEKIKNYFFDIKDFSKLKKVILNEKPDIIFHLAAQAIVSESYVKPIETIQSNTLGSINLLHSASFLKKKCICVMVTSDKCYFNLEKNNGYKEESRLGGKDMYSGSKAAAEILINSYFHSFDKKNKLHINYVIFRFFNVCSAIPKFKVGELHDPETHLIPLATYKLRLRKSLKIYGNNYQTKDGTCIRDYIHISDLCLAFQKSINLFYTKEVLNRIFNLGSGRGYSVLQIINAISKKINLLNIKNFLIISPRRLGDNARLVCNYRKAFKFLKWKPKKSI